MDVVFAHADRIMVLARGRVIADGTPAEIRDNEQVREVYFGSGRVVQDLRQARERDSSEEARPR